MYHNETSRLRVIHNVANGPEVDGYLDQSLVLKKFPYKKISDYLEIKSGEHMLDVYVNGTKTLIGGWDFTLKPGNAYTLIVHGLIKNLNSIDVLLLEDNLTCPANNKSHVRFIHAAAGVPDVDIYGDNNKVFSNVKYGNTGSPVYLPVNNGKINLSVTPANKNAAVLGPLALNLENRGIYTIIASGLLGDNTSPLTALVSEDSKGSCIVMNNF